MRLTLGPVVAAILMGSASAEAVAQSDPAAEKLAQQKACLTCHTVDKKVVGPSYREVAKKYAGQKDATSLLVAKVTKGGSGVWGPIPMPPQALTDAEAQQLVAWVLKQK